MKRNFGFTLLEILVAISIIVLLSSLGLASYVKFNRRQIVEQSTAKIVSELRLAQSFAANQQKPESGCLTLNGYFFNVDDDGVSYWISPDCSPLLVEKTKEGLVSGVIMTGFSKIEFNVLGRGVKFFDGKTQLTVSNGAGYSKTISVGEAGDIKIN